MDANKLSTAVACAVLCAIAVLSAVRGRREPLSIRLAVLCILLFAYEALDLGPGKTGWDWLMDASASILTPAFFDFALTFVGRRRELRRWVFVCYAYFGAIAIACLSAVVTPSMTWFPGQPMWAALVLAGIAPTVAAGGVLAVQHARRSGAQERGRTALVFGAIMVAALGATDDLVVIYGAALPKVSAYALAISAGLLAITAFRTKVLERVSVLVGINVAVLGLVVVLGEIALQGVGGRPPLLIVGSLVLAVLTLLGSRFLFGALSEHRERTYADAALGRMSRQMAHDLRNPLSAIRGAAQFLQGERAAGRPLEERGEYLDLVVEQADRMERVIEQYQRLGRVKPRLATLDVNALVERAVRSIELPVKKSLSSDLPSCNADEDLMTIAIENLLRNAKEAVGEGGHIEVTTARTAKGIRIAVADDGPGMDARTRERAFEDFFTTKASGSGLGLSFVQRVIHAHSGRITIESGEGQGTRVVVELPVG